MEALTDTIWKGQCLYVPHKDYTARTDDLPWFGPRCREAAETKYRAWTRYKQRRTPRNRDLHRQACHRMEEVQRQAIHAWKQDVKSKLMDGNCSSRNWWQIVKQNQGCMNKNDIPPLNKPDNTIAFSNAQKADAFAQYFSNKMKVAEPDRQPPQIPQVTSNCLKSFKVDKDDIVGHLKTLDTSKATGPDQISPRIFKLCAKELAEPIATILQSCITNKQWPKLWKLSYIVPVYKKGANTEIKNYRPVALLSVISKVCEKILYEQLHQHLADNKIIRERQYGSRKGRSAADLHLLLTSRWSAALDKGLKTMVLAIDIDGAFDKVWQ